MMADVDRLDDGPDAPSVGSAYDSIAEDYDQHLRRDRWMRRALWLRFRALFGPGAHVLDVGCGTGIDAVHLASRGVLVTAVDVSVGMTGHLRAKLAGAPFERLVDVRTGSVVEVARSLAGPFDGIVSSFAALNTVDLASFAVEAARLLRPGARVVAHLLARDHAAPLRQRLLGIARPTAGSARVEIDIRGHRLAHRLGSADELFGAFLAGSFVERGSAWLSPLVGLVSAGRFHVVELERRSDSVGSPPAAPS
jgi:SAM-dependent methyltransferase